MLVAASYSERDVSRKTRCIAPICPLRKSRRSVSITRTRGNIDARAISLGISRNCANSRVYGLVSDAPRCNDNKRDVAHGRWENRNARSFSAAAKRHSRLENDRVLLAQTKRPGSGFFAGIWNFILVVEGRRLSALNIKDNWSREKKNKGHAAKVEENPRKYRGAHFDSKFSYTTLVCGQQFVILWILFYSFLFLRAK